MAHNISMPIERIATAAINVLLDELCWQPQQDDCKVQESNVNLIT